MKAKQIHFGDFVQVVENPLTNRLGLAGLTGRVYGEATPSITCISVVGEPEDDYAVNVYFNRLNKTCWMSPQCLRLIVSSDGFGIENRKRDSRSNLLENAQ